MKKSNSVRLTIILMTVAMIALIGFQFHWIQRDLILGKKNFERNAKFALNSVLEKYLEHQITSKSHIVFNTTVGDFSSDSVDSFFFSSTTDSSHKKPSFKIKTTGVSYSTSYSTDEEIVKVHPEEGSIQVIVENLDESGSKKIKHKIYEKQEVVHKSHDRVHATVDINVEETDGVSTWTWENEEKVIDFDFLKKAMRQELEKQGLGLAYLFGVYNRKNNQITHRDVNGADSSLLNVSEYRIPLLGNQIESSNTELLLHFPNKDGYLWKGMIGVLLTSLALIGIVATCFWFAIRTILHQKRLSDIKNDFINNMTHEFKTPISNVSLAIEALQNFGMMTKPETTKKYLEIAKKENTRLGKQVEKVLQMALLEKEEFKLKLKPISLHEVVEQVVDSFKLQIEQKGGEIKPHLQATNDLLEADELHLTNVIFNLVDNANKYSPEKPEITIQTENTTEGLKIAVIDKGIGIAKDHLKQIFQKFYRVPTGNVHNVKGFGLGLSYVGQIVQRHHGTINVKSEQEQGSCFEIILPYKQV